MLIGGVRHNYIGPVFKCKMHLLISRGLVDAILFHCAQFVSRDTLEVKLLYFFLAFFGNSVSFNA